MGDVRSVNGPSNTFIVGRWHNPAGDPGSTNDLFGSNAVRCVCIDAGLVMDWMSDPADPHGRNPDLDGGPRVRHRGVDMGVHELRVVRGATFSAE